MVAGFRVNFPAQNTVINLTISLGDGLTGAVVSTFLADITEIDQTSFRLVTVRDQGQIGCHHSYPHAGTLAGSHQQSHPADFS
jgi:hypothetical protein